jgi:hypothetical protein
MKLTRKLIRRLVKEETQRVLNEASWSDETGSDLLDFAKSYASLGNAVQEQVDSVVSAYYTHGLESTEFQEAVYEQNPAAIEMAIGRMGRAIRYLGTDEAEDLMSALETAQKIYVEGDEEVALDQASAETRDYYTDEAAPSEVTGQSLNYPKRDPTMPSWWYEKQKAKGEWED